MNNRLKELLVCPNCNKSLTFFNKEIFCKNCKSKFKNLDNIPVFINKKVIKISEENSLIGNIARIFIYQNPKPIKIMNGLISKYKDKKILNVGSGNTTYENSINLDINIYKNVNIVADAHKLPFKDNSIDFIICFHVLEHVVNPFLVIEEFYRILKPRGSIYIEVPFIQRFHSYPNDYYRFTVEGLKEINKKFSEISYGVAGGPIAALNEFVVNLLKLLAGNNKFFFVLLLVLILPFIYLFKLLEPHVLRKKDAYILASGVYFVGEKK